MGRFYYFAAESNRIEGIEEVRAGEEDALYELLLSDKICVEDLVKYVSVIQPNAQLRATTDVPDVYVGIHHAPSSGAAILEDLERLLDKISRGAIDYHIAHIDYEKLHPFTDGNGRSGRALWLWHRHGHAPLGFLHQFYYDTLARAQGRSDQLMGE